MSKNPVIEICFDPTTTGSMAVEQAIRQELSDAGHEIRQVTFEKSRGIGAVEIAISIAVSLSMSAVANAYSPQLTALVHRVGDALGASLRVRIREAGSASEPKALPPGDAAGPADPYDDEYPWQSVFMEATLRALRSVHYSHQPLTLGRPGLEGQGGWLHRLNTGHGIEIADERVVCSQIRVELATTRTTAWVDFPERQKKESTAGARLFEFDHEEYCNLASAGEERTGARVDLLFRRSAARVGRQSDTETSNTADAFARVYIEAKRAQVWTVSEETGLTKPLGANSNKLVKADIKKLEIVRKSLEAVPSCDALFYALVWGYVDGEKSGTSAPDEFFGGITSLQPANMAVRWLPLAWEHGTSGAAPGGVTRWLWVALRQVLPPLPTDRAKHE